MREKALQNLSVVELGGSVAVGYATKLMADLGAEVIKVEKPSDGDDTRRNGPLPDNIPNPECSGLFLYLNTNKKSITLNLESNTGRNLLKKLISQIDVFIEHTTPSWINTRGLGYNDLHTLNKGLIMTSITPFGQTGPYRDYVGYDLNCQALGGLSVGIGSPEREPLRLSYSQSYYQAGIAAAIATMGALFQRGLNGEGQHVDISISDVLATIHTGGQIVAYIFRHIIGKRQGFRVRGQPYPHAIFRCKDGFVALQAAERRQWEKVCDMMGRPDWTQNPKYKDRIAMSQMYAEEVDALMEEWLIKHTKEELFALGGQSRLPIGPVYTNEDVVRNSHLKEREYWVSIDHPVAGTLKYPGAPYKLSKTPAEVVQPAPLLGQHNEEIYCQRLGVSREDLVDMRRAEII
jgi:crotonobetainyl-CoA:carnitine CoA-transferase CaiB-like acyl-CoA transferase